MKKFKTLFGIVVMLLIATTAINSKSAKVLHKLESDNFIMFVTDTATAAVSDSIAVALNPKPTASDTINERFNIKLVTYVDKMGLLESGNRYNITNQYGYKGKYQFANSTLRLLGYSREEIKGFMSNPELQEEAMVKLTVANAK